MNIAIGAKALPVWKTIIFRNLGFSFKRGSMKDYIYDKPGYAFLGPTGGLNPRGPVSPEGQATLVLASKTDLSYADTDTPTYREILDRGKAFGLRPARPCIGPQLLFQYSDQPIGTAPSVTCRSAGIAIAATLRALRIASPTSRTTGLTPSSCSNNSRPTSSPEEYPRRSSGWLLYNERCKLSIIHIYFKYFAMFTRCWSKVCA